MGVLCARFGGWAGVYGQGCVRMNDKDGTGAIGSMRGAFSGYGGGRPAVVPPQLHLVSEEVAPARRVPEVRTRSQLVILNAYHVSITRRPKLGSTALALCHTASNHQRLHASGDPVGSDPKTLTRLDCDCV